MTVVRYLLCEVKGLEPEGKYLLVRLLLSHQSEGGFVSTATELSERFGVRLSSVTKALKLLEAQALFSVAAAPEGRGRPKRRFTFTKQLTALLEKVTLPEGSEPAISIEPFLSLDTNASPESQVWRPGWGDDVLVDRVKSRRLSIANRLLIAVLLTKADRFGVVSSLGLAELRKATGLSKERLIYRLARLVAIGVIRCCVPGGAGRRILGLAKSAYLLNLADPELSVLGVRPIVFVQKFEPNKYTGWSSLLGDIFGNANQPRLRAGRGDPELESLGRLTRVQDFFTASDRRRLSAALEFRLLSYASGLLSSHWELVPSSLTERPDPLPAPVPELQKALSEDFRPPKKATVEANGSLAEEHLARLHECLWEAVYRKATEIKCLLLSRGVQRHGQMEYMVLPDALKNAFLTVLALPKAETALSGCYVWPRAGGEPKCYLAEHEISASDRLDYGLLSRPKPRVVGHQD